MFQSKNDTLCKMFSSNHTTHIKNKRLATFAETVITQKSPLINSNINVKTNTPRHARFGLNQSKNGMKGKILPSNTITLIGFSAIKAQF